MNSLSKIKIKRKFTEATRFFTIVVTIVFLFVFGFGLVQNSKLSINRFKSTLTRYLPELELFLSQNDFPQLYTKLDQLTVNIKQDVLPITSYIGLSTKFEKDVDVGNNLMKKWLDVLQPLLKYKITSNGFEIPGSEKYFTNDLSSVFDSLDSLLEQTKSYWQQMFLYRSLAFFLNNSQINNFLNIFEQILNQLPWLVQNKDNILTGLGHFSSKKIVIFNQNTGEARPNGGFTGSYIPVDLFKGKIKIGQSQSIYYVSNSNQKKSFAHPATWYYGYLDDRYDLHGLHNSNFFSCFNDSASLLETEFSNSPNGYNIDTVVLLNSSLIKEILPDNFSLKVDDDLVINSFNILEEIERTTSIEADDISNPKYRLSSIFRAILDNLDTVIKELSSLDLISNAIGSVLSRDIQIWFLQSQIQKFWSDLGLAADKNCMNINKTNFISPLIANISEDKRNLITKNQFNIYYKKEQRGYVVNVKYKQILPEIVNLQRGFKKFNPFTFVGLQIPSEATELQVNSPQALELPFLRKYYGEFIKLEQDRDLLLTEQIKIVTKTAKDLPFHKAGFSYMQPDNSTVLGIYIADETISEVNFSFKLSNNFYNNLVFYGQPGLNEPLLSLGKDLSFREFSNTKFIADKHIISQGIDLKFER